MTDSNNFTKAMEFVAKWEAGFADLKGDPGGKTKFGISDAGDGTIDGMIDLDRDGKGDVKVAELTLPEALEIYYKFYWLASGCEKLELPLSVVVFDTAVNCGVSRAKRWLKETQDPKTFIGIRKLYYYSLKPRPGFDPKKFIKGWLNRLLDLDKFVHILATP